MVSQDQSPAHHSKQQAKFTVQKFHSNEKIVSCLTVHTEIPISKPQNFLKRENNNMTWPFNLDPQP